MKIARRVPNRLRRKVTMLKLLERHVAPQCSRCGQDEPKCSSEAVAVVCSSCSAKIARKLELQEHACLDCDTMIAGDLMRCPRHQKQADLAAKMQKRAKRYANGKN